MSSRKQCSNISNPFSNEVEENGRSMFEPFLPLFDINDTLKNLLILSGFGMFLQVDVKVVLPIKDLYVLFAILGVNIELDNEIDFCMVFENDICSSCFI